MTGTISPTLPAAGEPNSTADPKVLGSLKTLRDEINALLTSENKIPDTSLASPNNSAYRTLLVATQFLGTDNPAGTFPLFGSANNGEGRASGFNFGGLNSDESQPHLFYLDDADYTVAGKTQKLRLRAQVAANATKPTIKFTFGLYPITVSGGTDELKITLGTVVSGSTLEVNEPAASTVTSGVGSDFAIPSDGAYALGVVTSATLTGNSAVLLSAQLHTRSV